MTNTIAKKKRKNRQDHETDHRSKNCVVFLKHVYSTYIKQEKRVMTFTTETLPLWSHVTEIDIGGSTF